MIVTPSFFLWWLDRVLQKRTTSTTTSMHRIQGLAGIYGQSRFWLQFKIRTISNQTGFNHLNTRLVQDVFGSWHKINLTPGQDSIRQDEDLPSSRTCGLSREAKVRAVDLRRNSNSEDCQRLVSAQVEQRPFWSGECKGSWMLLTPHKVKTTTHVEWIDKM